MTDVSEVTPGTVARWMLRRLEQDGRLYQRAVVREIAARFGEEWTPITSGGHLAVDWRVRKKFKQLGGDALVWDCRSFCWRWRRQDDVPGRNQDYPPPARTGRAGSNR